MIDPKLPLCYCTNVHAGATLEQAKANLDAYAPAIQRRFGKPMGVGLWLSDSALREAISSERVMNDWSQWLSSHQLTCYTMNAFPFGDFHAERVKEQVYLPDWMSPQRREYTCAVAEFLAKLLPEGAQGSISTLPLGFKPSQPASREPSDFFPQLIETADYLAQLADRTGKVIRLAIEPEPYCMIETSQEAVWFFESLRDHVVGKPSQSAVKKHLGLCFDVCHQSVEFEDVAMSLRWLEREGVAIVKMQLSCAIEFTQPTDDAARATLAKFAEPRYLHQTFARQKDGLILSTPDLSEELATNPPAEWRDAERWRTHFHVPLHLKQVGNLATTQPDLIKAIDAAKSLASQPHFEVETYTWSVLDRATELSGDQIIEGMAAELEFAAGQLSS